tara:strand:+ start:498 stop:1475 length:978 start_codon:yes stop_codon:yes gene_type:complete
MLMVRSPLRISLGGGGTDLPSYYRKKGGYLIASSIDKYIYTSVIKPFKEGIYLKYSDLESVKDPDKIKHKIFREILMMQEDNHQIEITTLADVPAGTGLGSSGAFTVSVLKALSLYKNKYISNEKLAKDACHIEIDRLGEPVGKQDQYASAIGGLNEFVFHKDDSVEFRKLPISDNCIANFEDSILLFFTGYSRSASEILKEQDTLSKKSDPFMIKNLDEVKEMGLIAKDLLIKGDIQQYGLLMHDHWSKKLQRSPNMCSKEILKYYEEGLNNGATGGKVVGAGGGGFLMFIANDKNALRNKMTQLGLKELSFKFDFIGTHTLTY